MVYDYFCNAKVKFLLNFYKWRNYSDEVSAKELIYKLILHPYKVRNRGNPEGTSPCGTELLSIDLTHKRGGCFEQALLASLSATFRNFILGG